MNINVNNALIEICDSNYTSMKYHSKKDIDLYEGSYIAIFSHYDNANANRILKVRHKETEKCDDILLRHNSIVIFSTHTNRNYLHKIVLDKDNNTNNRWLGITFRLSKTFIKFVNEIPYFENGKRLIISDEPETQENINYTISPGDLLVPKFLSYYWVD